MSRHAAVYLKVDNLEVIQSLWLRTRHNELKAIWQHWADHSCNRYHNLQTF